MGYVPGLQYETRTCSACGERFTARESSDRRICTKCEQAAIDHKSKVDTLESHG